MFNLSLQVIIISISVFTLCDCIGPFSITAGLAAVIAGYKGATQYYYKEKCNNNWIEYDHISLKNELDSDLYGQHLVKNIVLKSLKAHVENKDPKKALVLSFHGSPGVGKNYVAKMIERNFFKEGQDSQFSHWYIGGRDFVHKDEILKYKKFLQKEIEESTQYCDRSIFVFDEVDKIPSKLFDVLTPYLDFHKSIEGINYRKNIFIFLSNAGAGNITNIALKFWTEGREREKIALKDLGPILSNAAFNIDGGLHESDIVKRNLIDFYVPFLPLERKHVTDCIRTELNSQQLHADIDNIAGQLQYYPPEVELFSIYGCRPVRNIVSLYGN